MTIKPVITATQKRGGGVASTDGEKKKEPHGAEQSGGHNQAGVVVRGSAQHRNVIDAHSKSPQQRGEVYDELPRHHRRSPHKNSVRVKRRDHNDHHLKRERVEREKLNLNSVAGVNKKCASPLMHGHAHAHGLAVGGVTGGVNSGGGNSPAQISGVGGKSPEPKVLGCQSPKSQNAVTQAAANLIKSVDDNYSGYNSGDEHLQPKEGALSADEWQNRDKQFEKCMSDRGYVLKPVEEDGACLFRAISLQIYGDEEMHDVVRQHTMDYIYKNREYYSHFVTEDINGYIKRKRRKDSHGNHIEIQAMSEIYGRPVEVYCYKPTPINIFNSEQLKNGYIPLRLSYQRGSHYNAILDPYNATVGVGLGLSGYKPELQTKEAVRLSEQLEIEQTMFEDKLKTTDWEATNEAIEEQIARESYLQWCRDNLQKQRAANATSTSATVTSAEAASDSEASPSKYSLQRFNSNSNISNNNNNSGNSTVTASAVGNLTGNSGTVAPQNSPTRAPLHDTMNLPAKTLNAFVVHNLKKDGNCDLGFESDDTDISSTSSIGGGDSLSNTVRTNNKLRGSAMRAAKKRRREQQQQQQQQQQLKNNNINNNKLPINVSDGIVVADVSLRKSPKLDKSTKFEIQKTSPEREQEPCTSKKSNTPDAQVDKTVTKKTIIKSDNNDSLEKLTTTTTAPTTKTTPTPTPTTASTNDGNSKKPPVIRSLYHELLEATYAADGFGQLSESEMLQRAIQMSTNDFIEEQQRKYLYRP